MRARTTLKVVLGVLSSLLALVSWMMTAAPIGQAESGRAAVVTESSKVILDETSITAPGFTGNAQLSIGNAIAWAGTDPVHRINVLTSADGLHYGSKITLGETTVDRPAVARMSAPAGGAVAVAWRGTDAAHRLNVLFDVYGARTKLTLNETSFTGPALAVFNGNLLLAWTGTDANHSLNVLPISPSSLSPGSKTILTQFSSNAGPTLTTIVKAAVETAILGWSTRTSVLDLAQSADGVHFTSALVGGTSDTSGSAPDELSFQSEGGPEDWITWTGTDNLHHLNVQWTSHYPRWTGAKTILPDLALGGPELAFNQGLLIAWTGTDAAHHLNVARLEGF